MQKFNCPSCAAEITFQSSVSVSSVCPYCRSLVVRHDKDVEAMGKMAQLPDDISPFQIGTTGKYKNIGFTLIGRMKIGWQDGSWNEWFMLSDDGRKGWLAEAQGSLAISFEIEDDLHPNTNKAFDALVSLFKKSSAKNNVSEALGKSQERPELGSILTLNKQKLQVVDIKDATCIGSEGELPLTAPKGRETVSIDLNGSSGQFACIEMQDDKRRIYVGNYVEFNDLSFGNLRELPGWEKHTAPFPTSSATKKKATNNGW